MAQALPLHREALGGLIGLKAAEIGGWHLGGGQHQRPGRGACGASHRERQSTLGARL